MSGRQTARGLHLCIKHLSFVFCLCAINAIAGTFIVKPGESINDKLKSLQPGDTLLVRAGTYNESLSLPRDGESGKRIVVKAYPNEKPIIANASTLLTLNKQWWLMQGLIFDQQGAASDAIKISGSNSTLRGCEIRNGKKDGIDGDKGSTNITIENCVIHDFVNQPGVDAHGIVVDPGAIGWKILKNKIYNCGGDCIQLYAEDTHAVSEYSKNFTISGNVFYTTLGDNSENALDFKGIDGCLVDGNELYGFQNKAWVVQKGCRNITASNNLIHDSERGIEFRGEGGKSQENIKLVRNVLYNIQQFYVLKFDYVANVELYHNTLVNSPVTAIRVEGQGISSGKMQNNLIANCGDVSVSATFNVTSDHNGWFKTDAGEMAGTGDVSGADPDFVNAAQANFRLAATSPAKDKGVNLGLPYAGARPDLGAYEIGMTTPVKLKRLSIEQHGAAILLRWEAGSARDFWGFAIERSTNGQDYFERKFIETLAHDKPQTLYEYVDREATAEHYWYRLRLMDLNGQIEYSDAVEIFLAAPSTFALHQNFPNPFPANSTALQTSTQIVFDLTAPVEVRVTIHNLLGQTVRALQSIVLPAGRHTLAWDGRNERGERVAAGLYVYRILALQSGATVWTAARALTVVR
ncbi:right-handed parallel beta-helix repeat-containing protein [candidate division KSB1 bacterium]|nr:right-handed parallel beta-helix repeat-containing protein [candidate division KSB1 bacterium]